MLFTSLLVVFLFGACEKEEPPGKPFNTPNEYNRSIQAEVKHLFDLSLMADSAVFNATIFLYEDRENFLYDGIPDAYRNTDSNGKATFELLSKDYYWVRAVHPDLGEQIDSISTPPNTNSFLFLTFY
jgi:hypothetical protein